MKTLDDLPDLVDPEKWLDFIKTKFSLNYVKSVSFLGGEPFESAIPTKFLELLKSTHGSLSDVIIHVQTNGSIKPSNEFIALASECKQFKFNLSIDGVGKVAEYQRKGTNWETVLSNAYKLCEIKSVYPTVHSTVTSYTVLDMEALIDFYIEISKSFPKMKFVMHLANNPTGMSPVCLSDDLRKIALIQLNNSLAKISDNKQFERIRKELTSIVNTLNNEPTKDFDKLVRITKIYDALRNENFKDVYGYNIN